VKLSIQFGYKIGICLLVCMSLIGEIRAQISREYLISGLIYKFTNHIEWPENNRVVFQVALFTSKDEISKNLYNISRSKKINDKDFKIVTFTKADSSILAFDVIFVGEDFASEYVRIFDLVERKPILLISENLSDKSLVMINLFDKSYTELSYEINKPNIINQKLKASNEILIMGGTEIDVVSIYLKSQRTLRSYEKMNMEYRKDLDSVQELIANNEEMLNQQKIFLTQQFAEIEEQKEFQAGQIFKIQQYEQELNSKSAYLNSQKNLLEKLTDSLIGSQHLLNKQYVEIRNGQYFLDTKTAIIDSINREIFRRNEILSSKDNVIEKQNFIMQGLYVAVGLSVTAAFIILSVLWLIRKKNMKLTLQKERIDYLNAQLLENNEELHASLDEIQLMQKQLIQSEKMASLGVLSAGIAHEINNPINFVYAGINSLLRDFKDIEPVIEKISQINPDSDNIREQLLEIEKLKEENYYYDAIEAIPTIINDIKIGADRTAEIVKGLRRFSRTDQGSLVPYDLHDGLETSLLLLRNKYKHQVQLIRDYDTEMTELMCYAGKMNQVFLNIISNAIDAVSDNGQITIKTRLKEQMVEVSIKDNGCGMDKDMLAKLFDPFFTTKPVGQGTGLGLSITYGIIKEHNGKIEVFSEPGIGTEFIISFPKV